MEGSTSAALKERRTQLGAELADVSDANCVRAVGVPSVAN